MKNQTFEDKIKNITGLLIFSDLIKEDKTGKELREALENMNSLILQAVSDWVDEIIGKDEAIYKLVKGVQKSLIKKSLVRNYDRNKLRAEQQQRKNQSLK